MPDKTPNDDPWADLYADLGVTERPSPIPATFATSPEVDDQSGDASDEDEAEGDDEADGGEGAPPELDEHGNPKKRKRRRRRRSKKKGDEVGPAPTLYDNNEPLPRVAARAPAIVDSEEPELSAEEDDGEETVPDVSALEGGTSEMTRELIATWNVPSWEEIVTGLYRPER